MASASNFLFLGDIKRWPNFFRTILCVGGGGDFTAKIIEDFIFTPFCFLILKILILTTTVNLLYISTNVFFSFMSVTKSIYRKWIVTWRKNLRTKRKYLFNKKENQLLVTKKKWWYYYVRRTNLLWIYLWLVWIPFLPG